MTVTMADKLREQLLSCKNEIYSSGLQPEGQGKRGDMYSFKPDYLFNIVSIMFRKQHCCTMEYK